MRESTNKAINNPRIRVSSSSSSSMSFAGHTVMDATCGTNNNEIMACSKSSSMQTHLHTTHTICHTTVLIGAV